MSRPTSDQQNSVHKLVSEREEKLDIFPAPSWTIHTASVMARFRIGY